MVAGGDFADGFACFVQDGIAVTWDGFVGQLDADEFLCHAVCFLLCQGFLADEFGLVELAEHGEAGHDGRDVCAELVAVEGQSDLEA